MRGFTYSPPLRHQDAKINYNRVSKSASFHRRPFSRALFTWHFVILWFICSPGYKTKHNRARLWRISAILWSEVLWIYTTVIFFAPPLIEDHTHTSHSAQEQKQSGTGKKYHHCNANVIHPDHAALERQGTAKTSGSKLHVTCFFLSPLNILFNKL